MTTRTVLLLTLVVAGSEARGAAGWWHFDEGAGTATADASGNGVNGTLFPGTTWVAGWSGYAIHTDGVDDYVEMPDADALDVGTGDFTVGAWEGGADQTNTDGDGAGDACDDDDDNDGLADAADACDATTAGARIDPRNACSIADLCPCDGEWRNHLQYVACVDIAALRFFLLRLLTLKETVHITTAAVFSTCGARPR